MRIDTKQFIVALLIFLLGFFVVSGLSMVRGTVKVVEANFKNLPHVIGDWTGVDYTFADEIYDELRADENFYRIYTNSRGDSLGLYIGYYGTERGGHPDHVPTGCYPGSGWGIEAITPLTVHSDDGAIAINVHNLYATKDGQSEQTLYWLQNFRGTVTSTGIEQNLEKLHTLLRFNRNDGAFIRVNSKVKSSREETIAFQKEFIGKLLPLLPEHWPVEEVV
jgi:EpsI family protein